MWLFNNPPYKILQDKYHFQPTAGLAGALQSPLCDSTAAVRIIRLRYGLVMTNHHRWEPTAFRKSAA